MESRQKTFAQMKLMLKQQLHMKKSPEDLLVEQKCINKEITQMHKLQTNSGKKAAYFCPGAQQPIPCLGDQLGGGRASSPTHDKELQLLIHSLNPVPPALRAGSARCRISTLSEVPAKIIAAWDSPPSQGILW